MSLGSIDYVVLALYFAFVLGIGFFMRRKVETSADFLTSHRSVPVWITSLAFIAANLGAQEVVGMCASGAKYGWMTAHFYWVGAVPAMLFIGVFMMPFYYGSKARSVPEYLRMRFDEKTRALNAASFAVMTVFSSGISMYALGKLFQLVLGWDFTASVLLSAAIVLAYTFLGGLTSAIYNEVLQFFLIVMGFAPLSILAVMKAGGWSGLQARLAPQMTHMWRYLGDSKENSMGVEVFGMVAGLGFVLSFGYWCTDFLVVQRAMAADSMSAARRTPLIAAFPKMIMPFIVILPGLAALALGQMNSGYSFPLKEGGGGPDYDLALTTLMAKFYPSGLLGVGLTALMASFMSGMAGNVTAFNTVFTYDLYQSYIRPRRAGFALLARGAADDGGRRGVVDCDGVSGSAVQQHHGFVAAGIFVRQRASVRYIPAGHVLEADDGAWSVHWAAGGNHGRGGDARVDGGGGKRRLDFAGAHVSFDHGAEFLDGDFRVVGLFRDDHRGEPDDSRKGRIGAARTGLRIDGPAQRRGRAVVPKAAGARIHRGRGAGDFECDFLVDA